MPVLTRNRWTVGNKQVSHICFCHHTELVLLPVKRVDEVFQALCTCRKTTSCISLPFCLERKQSLHNTTTIMWPVKKENSCINRVHDVTVGGAGSVWNVWNMTFSECLHIDLPEGRERPRVCNYSAVRPSKVLQTTQPPLSETVTSLIYICSVFVCYGLNSVVTL